MTEAEGFGVAVRAYYYAVIPTLSTANTIWVRDNNLVIRYQEGTSKFLL